MNKTYQVYSKMQLTEDLPGVVLPTPWMDDRRERDYLVTDENGCATNPPFFGEWQYGKQKGVLTSVFNAFKFPSSINIRFKCNIQVCSGNCQPQNCSGSSACGREKREANAEEDVCVSFSPLLSVTVTKSADVD